MSFEPQIIKEIARSLLFFRRSSALAPSLVGCLVLTLPCSALAANRGSVDIVTYSLLGFASVPVILLLFKSMFFTISDPDRLHSERFQTDMRTLAIGAKDKGTQSLTLDVKPNVAAMPPETSDE